MIPRTRVRVIVARIESAASRKLSRGDEPARGRGRGGIRARRHRGEDSDAFSRPSSSALAASDRRSNRRSPALFRGALPRRDAPPSLLTAAGPSGASSANDADTSGPPFVESPAFVEVPRSLLLFALVVGAFLFAILFLRGLRCLSLGGFVVEVDHDHLRLAADDGGGVGGGAELLRRARFGVGESAEHRRLDLRLRRRRLPERALHLRAAPGRVEPVGVVLEFGDEAERVQGVRRHPRGDANLLSLPTVREVRVVQRSRVHRAARASSSSFPNPTPAFERDPEEPPLPDSSPSSSSSAIAAASAAVSSSGYTARPSPLASMAR